MNTRTTGRWQYHISPDGIITISVTIDLDPPSYDIRDAMTRLAATAAHDATIPPPQRHGEPL